MKSFLILAFIFLFSIPSFSYPLIPNPEWAKGSLCDRQDSDYEKDRYSQKIPYCRRNVETSLKHKLYDLYQIPENCRKRYTIDHIIPLSVGGDNTPQNLWPEHVHVKATRMRFEEEIFHEVRDGNLSQKEAVEIIIKEKFTPKRPSHKITPCD